MIFTRRPHVWLLAGAVAAVLASTPLPASVLFAADDAARSDSYRAGQRALSEERWPEALSIFTSLADAKGPEADAALYWKAWTESKLGRRGDALSSIRSLLGAYPKSSWADDAKALELELRGPGEVQRSVSSGSGTVTGSGRGTANPDEDLQLYALDGLMQVEPARAVPILERFLAADHSLKLKEKALFVLAQSDTPRARQVLLDLVRRGTPPELRLEAVEQLGIAGGPEDLRALAQIWNESTLEVKRRVLEAWMVADQKEPVFAVARDEKDPELRRKAIELLGVMDATTELGQLYASEKSPEVRAKLLEAYGVAGDIGALSRAARQESDPELRHKAIEGLGVAGGKEGSRALVELYGSEKELELRKKIVEALMIADDAEALVKLFHAETNPELKRDILQKISLLDDESVEQVLRDVLEDKP